MNEVQNQTVLLSRKRHINYGRQSFENEEFHVCVSAFPTIDDNRKAQNDMQKLLNEIHLDAVRNHAEIQQLRDAAEEAVEEKARLERDTKDAEFRKELFAFIEVNPKANTDDLVLTFEKSRREISEHVMELQNLGKIKRAACRETFVIDDFEDDEEEDL